MPPDPGAIVWEENPAHFRRRRWVSVWTYAGTMAILGLGLVSFLWYDRVLPLIGFLLFGALFALVFILVLLQWLQQRPVRVHMNGVELGFWRGKFLEISNIEVVEDRDHGKREGVLILLSTTDSLQYRFGTNWQAAVRIGDTVGFMAALTAIGVRRIEHKRAWEPRAERAVRTLGKGMAEAIVRAESIAAASGAEVVTSALLRDHIDEIANGFPDVREAIQSALGPSGER